jgi:hypothetical protein
VSGALLLPAASASADDLCVGKRISAAGTVGSQISFGASAFSSDGCNVALAPDGEVTVVWTGTGSQPPVLAQQVSAAGTVGPALTIGTAPSIDYAPNVVAAPDGTVTVLYNGLLANVGTSPMARRIAPDGSLGANIPLSTSFGFFPDRSGNAGVATDGTVVAAWVEEDPSHNRHFKARRISPAGSLGAAHDLSGAISNNCEGPFVSVEPDSDATIFWTEAPDLCNSISATVRRVNSSDVLGTAQTVTTQAHNLAAASSAAGNTTLAWTVLSGGTVEDLIGQIFSSAGTLGTAQTVGSSGVNGTLSSPTITLNSSGVSTLVWSDYQFTGTSAIHARRLDSTSMLAPTTFDVGADGFSVDSGIDSSGDVRVSWGLLTSSVQGVQTRELSAAGVLGTTQTLSTTEGDSPKLAVAPDGSSFVVWGVVVPSPPAVDPPPPAATASVPVSSTRKKCRKGFKRVKGKCKKKKRRRR